MAHWGRVLIHRVKALKTLIFQMADHSLLVAFRDGKWLLIILGGDHPLYYVQWQEMISDLLERLRVGSRSFSLANANMKVMISVFSSQLFSIFSQSKESLSVRQSLEVNFQGIL